MGRVDLKIWSRNLWLHRSPATGWVDRRATDRTDRGHRGGQIDRVAGLAAKGAVVVDADAIVRELQEPGTQVFAEMVERFGPGIVAEDGNLDRGAIADLVFADPTALADLGSIVHPRVHDEITRRLEELEPTDHVVILDVPLLVESGWEGMQGTIVVDLDPEVAVERLVAHRGFSAEDARSRIARQATREHRLSKADLVIDNHGHPDELGGEIERAWEWIASLGD